jgi:hypothetical protein
MDKTPKGYLEIIASCLDGFGDSSFTKCPNGEGVYFEKKGGSASFEMNVPAGYVSKESLLDMGKAIFPEHVVGLYLDGASCLEKLKPIEKSAGLMETTYSQNRPNDRFFKEIEKVEMKYLGKGWWQTELVVPSRSKIPLNKLATSVFGIDLPNLPARKCRYGEDKYSFTPHELKQAEYTLRSKGIEWKDELHKRIDIGPYGEDEVIYNKLSRIEPTGRNMCEAFYKTLGVLSEYGVEYIKPSVVYFGIKSEDLAEIKRADGAELSYARAWNGEDARLADYKYHFISDSGGEAYLCIRNLPVNDVRSALEILKSGIPE